MPDRLRAKAKRFIVYNCWYFSDIESITRYNCMQKVYSFLESCLLLPETNRTDGFPLKADQSSPKHQ